MLLIRFISLLIIALGLCAAPAMAQQAPSGASATQLDPGFDRRKLMVPPKNADGTIQVTPFSEDPVLWLRDQQQAFYNAMSKAMRRIASEGSAAGLTLILLSFAYGVFHAAGPGHGKTVVSAWLLATENELRRGILIAFMSSIIQALTAIVIVSLLLLLATAIGTAARDVAGVLESASYAMIAGLGAYLIWMALASRPVAPVGTSASVTLHHFDSFTPAVAADHVHGPECGCGHAHVPEAKDLRGDWSWPKALSLSVAVGIRPCTGALLVLVFANTLGLYWAGVASTFAMALGTFITVSAIASLAVFARKLATRFAGRDERWLRNLSFAVKLFAGSGILLLGGALFWASLGSTATMG